jgi:hypothetical protein
MQREFFDHGEHIACFAFVVFFFQLMHGWTAMAAAYGLNVGKNCRVKWLAGFSCIRLDLVLLLHLSRNVLSDLAPSICMKRDLQRLGNLL